MREKNSLPTRNLYLVYWHGFKHSSQSNTGKRDWEIRDLKTVISSSPEQLRRFNPSNTLTSPGWQSIWDKYWSQANVNDKRVASSSFSWGASCIDVLQCSLTQLLVVWSEHVRTSLFIVFLPLDSAASISSYIPPCQWNQCRLGSIAGCWSILGTWGTRTSLAWRRWRCWCSVGDWPTPDWWWRNGLEQTMEPQLEIHSRQPRLIALSSSLEQ